MRSWLLAKGLTITATSWAPSAIPLAHRGAPVDRLSRKTDSPVLEILHRAGITATLRDAPAVRDIDGTINSLPKGSGNYFQHP